MILQLDTYGLLNIKVEHPPQVKLEAVCSLYLSKSFISDCLD